MNLQTMTNFKATALTNDDLHHDAPSIFALRPMQGVSDRYTFVPTSRLIAGLREHDWVPVAAEEQRIRIAARRGFQKHLLRFRRAEQMRSLDEWNVELVLLNSHDRGCAYQLHAGIYRRICHNGLVVGEGSFQTIRFRHAGLVVDDVVRASFRLVEYVPRVGELVHRFRARILEPPEIRELARHALLLRYPTVDAAPIDAESLLQARRPEDESQDLWTVANKVQENLVLGGLSDHRRDRRGRLRSMRALRGIDSKVTVNKGLWDLATRLADGKPLANPEPVTVTA